MTRMRRTVTAAALVATLVPLALTAPEALGGATAHAAVAATAAEPGTVVQEGGRLTVPAGEEGAVTLRFTATLPAGVTGKVSGALHLPDQLDGEAGGGEVSDRALVSTCAVNGVAYGACAWKFPFNDMGFPFDPPSLTLPSVPAATTLAYAVTLDADETALRLGSPDTKRDLDARVELKDGTGAVVARGTVQLSFVPGTPPAAQRGTLHARDRSGVLWRYEGTSLTTRPFERRKKVGGGWQVYTVITPLWKPNAAGGGDMVARDRSGVLWYYGGTGNPDAPFKTRVRIGGGWNQYTAITGDSVGGLVARDASGVLWHYETKYGGAGQFYGRVKVGGGWNAYNRMTTLTGPDGALARDAAGALWKYDVPQIAPGPPFTRKQLVGTGWNRYTAFAGTGELGRDKNADLVARDASGNLWLHQGERLSEPQWNPSLYPSADRSLIGGGWNTYDLLI
ncbi:tachylectin-related carbohydrate-binding protein [Streptomyces sp. NPDC007863]|uniref:tachylectin-related carbohydrate-binding protein n=1 Tax=Streptomyces sp. NPDC007863 TaxID=3154894 RepID=UPI0033F50C80